MPKTLKQIEQIRALGKRPKTKAQRDAARISGRRNMEIMKSLPRTEAQRAASRRNGRKLVSNPHKGLVFANGIIEHHNDLCHGRERPDDITPMTLSEHSRLHGKLNGKRLSEYGKRLSELRERDNKGQFL